MSLKQVCYYPRRRRLSDRRAPRANTPSQEIVTWVTALEKYDNNELEAALEEFEKVADTSKILFNMGVIHATLGEHSNAVRDVIPCGSQKLFRWQTSPNMSSGCVLSESGQARPIPRRGLFPARSVEFSP